jgi:DNA-binding LacI/PurR family transcriptional regulator
MSKNNPPLTITQIAKELKVSPGTISKVFTSSGYVSEKTKNRILKYVKKVGYVPNHSARILKSKTSKTLGIVFADIGLFGLEHNYFGPIIQAFKNFVENEGYEIVFIPKKIGDREPTMLAWVQNKQVDGVLILTGNINNAQIIELVNSGIPCVSSDVQMKNLFSVYSDDQQGVNISLDYLFNKGNRKIAAISGPITSRAYAERTKAFFDRMNAENIPIDELHPWYTEISGYSFNSALEHSLIWIDRWQEKPETILAFSDDIAMGLIRALEVKGYRVPQDIAVIGYDDNNFARIHKPALTTIRQDKKLIAETCGKALIDLINRKDFTPETIVLKLPVHLIIRESCK